MKDAMRILLGLLLVGMVALVAVCAYSRQQVQALQGQPVYATPEEGTQAMAAEHYAGLQEVEIIHAGYEPCALGNLFFVEAKVWARSHSDGHTLREGGDNPGWFFLWQGEGWVFVSEERWPWFIALGQRLLGG
jgi:hypothetical protein